MRLLQFGRDHHVSKTWESKWQKLVRCMVHGLCGRDHGDHGQWWPDHGDLLGVAGEAVHHGGALLAAGHSLAPASRHSSLDLIRHIMINMDIMENTYTGAPVLQEPRVILVPDLENSLDMFPDEGPQHGPASRWRLCVVLRAAVRRLWSHGGGWEDGGGLAWACLYTASAQPSQTRAHGAAAALVLCIPQSGLFICKWLQINSFSSAGPLNALYELILSVKAAFLGLIFLQILWHVI